jgi:hypothetical protein
MLHHILLMENALFYQILFETGSLFLVHQLKNTSCLAEILNIF